MEYVDHSLSRNVCLNFNQLKPPPGSDDALIRSIPGSCYCFRLWPGPVSRKHYYLDFVDSSNAQNPINSPIEFSLWTTTPTIPALSTNLMRVLSLEEKMGVRREDIRPGEERYILIEGQECVLRRSGKRDVSFTVPTRSPVGSHFKNSDVVNFLT